MRDDIREIVDRLISGCDDALRSADDEEYVEAMEELASTFKTNARAKREEMEREG